MSHQADGSFLTEDARSTRPVGASFFGSKACRLREEKTNFVCLDSRATKPLSHSNPVTAVTDNDNLTLVMCSYSANSIFGFATSSSSGEIQVDSRPSLNRDDLPGRSSQFKKIGNKAESAAGNRAPSRTRIFRNYLKQIPRPDSQFNDLKTATSAFRLTCFPAANTFNQQPQPSC